MQVFILFQTDRYKSNSSRVCFGVYESKAMAEDAAIVGELKGEDSDYIICPTELNDFDEV